jgi:hypothetical protein
VHLFNAKSLSLEVLATTNYHTVRRGIELNDIEGLSGTANLQPTPLSNRKSVNAIVLTNRSTIFGHYLPSPTTAADLRDEILYASRNETDILTLGLLRGSEPCFTGYLSNLWLRVVSDRKQRLAQLLLSTGIEEVALIFIPIDTSKQMISIVTLPDARVVTRRNFATAKSNSSLPKLSKLHLTVAIDTGIRSEPTLVRLYKSLNNLALKCALKIDHIEWDR